MLLYPIWSIPTFFVLRAMFKGLKGSLLVASLSIPGLIAFLFATFGPLPYTRPASWLRLLDVLHESPDLCVSAVVAILCVIQLVLVANKRLNDPPTFSLRTIGTSIVIISIYWASYSIFHWS